MRLWCFWRTRRITCGIIYRNQFLHGCEYDLLDSPCLKLTFFKPERITGREYSIRSDVWSTGISLLELVQNRFPYPNDISLIELLDHIKSSEVRQSQLENVISTDKTLF